MSMLSSLVKENYFISQEMRDSIIIWHLDPLLGYEQAISNCATVIIRQMLIYSNRRTVSSVQSLPRCCEQNELDH
jgi:hypothetical protein